MNYILLFFLLLSCNVQEQQGLPSLVNTKWEYKVAEDCVSYIAFKADSTYEDYNCELDFPFSGNYKVKKDTLYLTEIGLASELPGTTQKIVKRKSKGILTNGQLKFIDGEELDDGKWIKSDYKPTQEVLYKKVVK